MKNVDETVQLSNDDEVSSIIYSALATYDKYKMTKNLFEYILIALCRIMTYEKILDLRMKFINNIDKKDLFY